MFPIAKYYKMRYNITELIQGETYGRLQSTGNQAECV